MFDEFVKMIWRTTAEDGSGHYIDYDQSLNHAHLLVVGRLGGAGLRALVYCRGMKPSSPEPVVLTASPIELGRGVI